MAGNEQVHLRRETEKPQVGILQFVRVQGLIPNQVLVRTTDRLLVTKQQRQQQRTRGKHQGDRKTTTRTLLAGGRL